MSTPDASQFILKKQYQAIQRRQQTAQPKGITHLSVRIPPTTGLPTFLASVTTKNIHLLRYPLVNFPTGLFLKSRTVPFTGPKLI